MTNTLLPQGRSRNSKKIYKIGCFNRQSKNAKRHLVKRIEASDPEEAKRQFRKLVNDYGNTIQYKYVLYTGDWKEIEIY